MAVPSILDVTSGQIEVVERDFQTIFEESDALGAGVPGGSPSNSPSLTGEGGVAAKRTAG